MIINVVSGTELLELAMAHSHVWAIDNRFAQSALAYLAETEYSEHRAAFDARMVVPVPAPNQVREEDRNYKIENGVAMIPIQGVMTMKPTSFGGCSTILARRDIRTATADQDVREIVLLVNSPGGSVEGTEELALVVGEASAQKRVTAYVQGIAGSAAYWVSSYATRIVMNRMALVGSIGAMNSLTDSSEQAAKDGRKVIVIASRPLKGQGTPGYPISKEAIAMIEAHVQYFGDAFDQVVLANRKLTKAQAEEALTAATFVAPDAMRLGLVDAVQPLEDLLAEMQESALSEDDDEDVDSDSDYARATETIGLTPAQASLPSASATATLPPNAPAAQEATPTISAPGGQDRPSAGISTAPPKGAEKPPTTGTRTMSTDLITKHAICRALTQRGYGIASTNLANDPAEDAFGVVNALVNQIDAEVKAKAEANPLLIACEANKIENGVDLAKLVQRAGVGDKARAELQKETYEACVQAHGVDIADIIAKGFDDAPYEVLAAKRDAYQVEAELKMRNGKDKPATRQTVPGGTALRGADVEVKEATERPFFRLPADQQAEAKALPFVGDDEAKQDAFALNLLGEAA